MKIRNFAVLSLLAFGSFAANNAAPVKTELEARYDKAFQEFDSNNYEQALKDLDAIDAIEPDLAESQNLRGVIQMRQKDYGNAEKSLQRALADDPKFWNARFNLAEIPFLERNWPEARKRFQELLNGDASELQGEATQLIQYKVLITDLMEGKEDSVQARLATFELSPETPALHYANAAIALQRKDEAGAREVLSTAEKNFSPQLNKIFAESLYEVGWLEKPAGETRAALELNSAADRATKTKAFAKARFDEAEQALAQRDLSAARKLVDEADAADPNQASVLNLRGEILLEQKEWDLAETEFKKAAKLDPKFRDAQYNLAQIPFKKKEYAKARDRFEALFSAASGVDRDQAAQLIKYKVYLTYLLEGKDARAQKLMEQFQFTGDTPALYYAQAAWEFQHKNPAKANEWVTSARKIYSPALNGIFSDAFYDLGWIQSAGSVEASGATVAEAGAGSPELAPSIEPTPIPATASAKVEDANPAEPLMSLAGTASAGAGMDAAVSSTSEPSSATTVTGAAASPSVETPVASTASPAAAQPVIANSSEETSGASEDSASVKIASASPADSTQPAGAKPATELAPAQVRDWAEPTASEKLERFGGRNILLTGVLLLGAILLMAWVVISGPGRRIMSTFLHRGLAPAGGVPLENVDRGSEEIGELTAATHLAGGPPQVSLQLNASEPALRRAVIPSRRNGRPLTNGNGLGSAPVTPAMESFGQAHPVVSSKLDAFDEGVGEAIEVLPGSGASFRQMQVEDRPSHRGEIYDEFVGEPAVISAPLEAAPAVAENAAMLETPSLDEIPPVADAVSPATESIASAPEEEDVFVAPSKDIPTEQRAEPMFVTAEEFFGSAAAFSPFEPPVSADAEAAANGAAANGAAANGAAEEPIEELVESAFVRATGQTDPVAEDESSQEDPVGQGQPIPYLTAATSEETPVAEFTRTESEKFSDQLAPVPVHDALAGIGVLHHFEESFSAPPQVGSFEQTAEQPTIPAIMPDPIQSMPAPVIRTSPNSPMAGGTSQPGGAMQPTAAPLSQSHSGGGGMHTAVQLTFSFEIASLQLTPTFKMGALQLKPTSRIVTMRLAPSQHPQPAMNLQVTFEIATVELNGNALGMVRLTPSQQQRPGIISSPSFNIAGLQLVSGSESAPVQLTPSQQGQASVHVTAPFQIATVEFSPSFEIASIVLNSTSKNVSVQLPGSGPSAVEGAPVFEVSNVELGGNGEIGVMQLNPQSAGPKQIA